MLGTEKISQLWRVATAAREVGIPRQTIRCAMDRGDIPSYEIGDGLPLVSIDELRQWAETPKSNADIVAHCVADKFKSVKEIAEETGLEDIQVRCVLHQGCREEYETRPAADSRSGRLEYRYKG